MATLQEMTKAAKRLNLLNLKSKRSKKIKIANKYLGKFKGIIPKGKTSTQFIRELRETLYGKIK